MTTIISNPMLSPEDSWWIEQTFRDAFEISRERQFALYRRHIIGSHTSVMDNTKELVEQPLAPAQGWYPDALRPVLGNHGTEPLTAERIVWLLNKCRSVLVHSRSTPSVDDGHTTEDFVPALEYAINTVFGPAALFQQMDAVSGPLGMAFIAHAVRLGHPDRQEMAGPFPLIPLENRKTTCLRTLHTWLSCEHLPEAGWFIPLKQEAGPSLRGRTAPKWYGSLPTIEQSDYADAYPWRDLVDLDDYYVYQLARTLAMIVRELKPQFGLEQAILMVRELVRTRPLTMAAITA